MPSLRARGRGAFPGPRFGGDTRTPLTEYTWEAGRMSYSVGSGGSAWALQLLAPPPTS